MNKNFLLIIFGIVSFVIIIFLCYIGYNKFYNNTEKDSAEIYEEENRINNISKKNDYIETTDKENKNEDKEVEVEKEKIPSSYTAAIPIYMYHWIKDDTGDYPWPENMVKISALKEQVEYLVKNNFELIWITDLEKIYSYKKPIALTFDDGWHDVYLHMFPLAQKYNIKFSMYVIKDMVGKPGYCTEEQLKEMAKSGLVDIQSHTVTHSYLAQLSYEAQKSELVTSKSYLKETYDIDSTVICYPYGSRNDNTVKISKEVGYKYGLDMDGGVYYTNKNTDMLKIPRIYATRSMNLDTFAKYANESYVNVVWEE